MVFDLNMAAGSLFGLFFGRKTPLSQKKQADRTQRGNSKNGFQVQPQRLDEVDLARRQSRRMEYQPLGP